MKKICLLLIIACLFSCNYESEKEKRDRAFNKLMKESEKVNKEARDHIKKMKIENKQLEERLKKMKESK